MTIDFLCTALGSLVYFDAAANRLRHAPAPPRNAALITEDGRSWLACRDGDVWQRLDRLSAGGHVGLAGDDAAPLLLTTRYLADGLLAPEANGLSLSAEPDGGVSLSRPIQGPRESFAPVSEADLDFLDDIRGRSWVNTSGKTIKDGIRLAPSFRAQIGDLTVPLRALLAARHRRHPDGFSVLFDGWKVETLTAFRPLVYFAAYGKLADVGIASLAGVRPLRWRHPDLLRPVTGPDQQRDPAGAAPPGADCHRARAGRAGHHGGQIPDLRHAGAGRVPPAAVPAHRCDLQSSAGAAAVRAAVRQPNLRAAGA
jgi:hypothetical protein